MSPAWAWCSRATASGVVRVRPSVPTAGVIGGAMSDLPRVWAGPGTARRPCPGCAGVRKCGRATAGNDVGCWRRPVRPIRSALPQLGDGAWLRGGAVRCEHAGGPQSALEDGGAVVDLVVADDDPDGDGLVARPDTDHRITGRRPYRGGLQQHGHFTVDQVGDVAECFDGGVDTAGGLVVDEVVEALVAGADPDGALADPEIGGDHRAAVNAVSVRGAPQLHAIQRWPGGPHLRFLVPGQRS